MIHSCTSCTDGFTSKRKLRRHIVEKHPEQAKYQCSTCELRYASRLDLVKHKHTAAHARRTQQNRIPPVTVNRIRAPQVDQPRRAVTINVNPPAPEVPKEPRRSTTTVKPKTKLPIPLPGYRIPKRKPAPPPSDQAPRRIRFPNAETQRPTTSRRHAMGA
jgi:hypothetical protein